MIARVEAGDAVWVEAIVARVAQILAPRFPDAGADELRSVAFGWLARPAELLQLLLEHRDRRRPRPRPGGEPEAASRATAFPADLLDALRDARPVAAGTEGGALRPPPRGRGPRCRTCRASPASRAWARVTLSGLQSLLARTHLTVTPVIDLSDRVRTTAYEHPESLKERVHLITGGDYWPYATSTSRRVDYDHPIPYDPRGHRGGPPGQTGTHNSGPLGRRHHRWKTHAGYRARQCGQGRYVWLTPHGLGLLVDHRGTRPITRAHAEMILDAPPGVDIYPGGRLRLAADVARSEE